MPYYSPEAIARVQALINEYLSQGNVAAAQNIYRYSTSNGATGLTLGTQGSPDPYGLTTGGGPYGTGGGIQTREQAAALERANAEALARMGGGSDQPPAGGAAPVGGGGIAPPPGLTDTQKSARALIQRQLDEYGLGGLSDRLWNQYLAGTPVEQIFSDLRKTPEYAARFPGMAELQRRNRAIDEGTYISVERQYVNIFRAAGIPQGFYDSPDDFGRFIANEVSPSELNERVQTYTRAAFQSPPEVRDQLQRLYGLGTGDLVAFFIDPDRALPLIQNAYIAAQTAGAAQRTGFGSLDRTTAENLASRGITERQAEEGFGALVDSRQLFSALDAGETDIDQSTQIGAAFEGNAAARSKIELRRRRRQAQFEGGGGFAADRGGLSGIGSAS